MGTFLSKIKETVNLHGITTTRRLRKATKSPEFASQTLRMKPLLCLQAISVKAGWQKHSSSRIHHIISRMKPPTDGYEIHMKRLRSMSIPANATLRLTRKTEKLI